MSARRPGLLYVVTLAEIGGAQAYVRDLLPAVIERFDVAVAAHGDGPLREATEGLGVPFFPLLHVRRELSARRDPLGFIELARLFRRLRPEIVHLNSSKAGVLGRIAAVPARVPVRVFTAHGWAFKATSGLASRAYCFVDRAMRPLTTCVVCVSEAERTAGLAAGTCLANRTVVIPNAVDVADAPYRRAGRPSGPLALVSVGRFAEPKDFSTLIAAVASLPTGAVRLTLIGDGPLRPQLEHEVAGCGLTGSVEFVGEVGDVPERIAGCDVFILSSRSEGMPISVLEAMAAGLPVIASAVGGLHEVVDEGSTGFLVPPGSVAALAGAIARFVGDPSLVDELGRAGRRRAEVSFSFERWRSAHVELYQSLVAG